MQHRTYGVTLLGRSGVRAEVVDPSVAATPRVARIGTIVTQNMEKVLGCVGLLAHVVATRSFRRGGAGKRRREAATTDFGFLRLQFNEVVRLQGGEPDP